MTTGTASAEEFIKGIQQLRDQGYGFVPLVGAGASAPSGVPIIEDIAKYLRQCIGMGLGLDAPGTPWDPRSHVWPPFHDLHQAGLGDDGPDAVILRDIDWVARVRSEFDERRRQDHAPSRTKARPAIVQEALGAMAEWKSSLLFLSRLRIDGDNIELGDRDQEVIDRFFRYVVYGKAPTLVHRMLAILADHLQFETILTTNFDELLEDAFSSAGIPLDVVDVHLQSGLPPYSSMRSRRMLVKLHGGKYGLRADYSLETYPSLEDRRHFASYLLGRSISAAEWEEKADTSLPIKNHLLLLGYSGADLRINALVHTALERYADRGLRVFWVCYSDEDVDRVLTKGGLQEQLARLPNGRRTRNRVFTVTRHSYLGLLFQQVYQHLSLSLPPVGVVFPSVSELPIPVNSIGPEKDALRFRRDRGKRWDPSVPHEGGVGATRERLDLAIDYCAASQSEKCQCVVVYSSEAVYGVSSIASEVFVKQMISKRRQCVWVDTDDIRTPDALFEQVVGAIAQRAGIADWVPLLLGEDTANRAREFGRLTRSSGRQWIVFLHVRDGAGSNIERPRLDQRTQRNSRFNGWLDDATPAGDLGWDNGRRELFAEATTDGFIHLLRQICGRECGNITVVVLCRKGRLTDRLPILDPIMLELTESVAEFSIKKAVGRALKWMTHGGPQSDYRNVAPAVRGDVESADTRAARLRFLTALVLCTRTRYPALLWSWAFHGRTAPQGREHSTRISETSPSRRYGALRFELTQMWIEQLSRLDVIRRKAGGFVWIHTQLRNELRARLAGRKGAARLASDIHHCLAEWYHKLFASSGDPMAVFEVVHHRCCAAAQGIGSSQDSEQASRTVCRKSLADLREARAILKSAKHSMLSKMFSKGKFDKLAFLRDRDLGEVEAAAALCAQRQCNSRPCPLRHELTCETSEIELLSHRLARAIAREVAEHTVAFRECTEYDRKAKRLVSRRREDLQSSRWCTGGSLRAHVIDAECEGLVARIETHNELGTLCIATRSYRNAQGWFERIYREFCFPIGRLEGLANLKPDDAAGVIVLAEQWAANPRGDPPSRDNLGVWGIYFSEDKTPAHEDVIRLGVIETLQRHMQLHLVEGHANHLQSRREILQAEREKLEKAMTQCYRRASACFWAAVEIMRFLPAECQQKLYYDRQRLETQYALALKPLHAAAANRGNKIAHAVGEPDTG